MNAIKQLAAVDVEALAAWVAGIDHGDYRMFADSAWRGCAERFGPIAEALVAGHFPGCRVAGLGLFVLAPGQVHPPHRDEQPPEWVTRLHVPLLTNALAVAIVDAGTLHLDVGFAYTFDTRQMHSVRNDGATTRVHLVLDVHRNPG